MGDVQDQPHVGQAARTPPEQVTVARPPAVRADEMARNPFTVAVPSGIRVPTTVARREIVAEEQTPRMRRRRGGKVVAGVAGGLADHLGVDVLWVRLCFAAMCALGGAGLLAYGLLWMFVPQRSAEQEEPRPPARERQQALGIAALGIGFAVAVSTLSGAFSGWIAAPLAIALIGAVVVWREADEVQRRRWFGGGWLATVRITAGVALVVTGIAVVVLRSGQLGQLQFALLAVVATLIGVAMLTVPFWVRLVRDFGEERATRIRTEERAEIAAHLHDSVLQTLALIQKQADSQREVVRLARAQERQLRGWLYGASGRGGAAGGDGATEDGRAMRFSEALAQACGEVEDTFAITAQHVVVGETDLGPRELAVVQAAREAMVNAAKHAGVDEVSVYAEVEPDALTVYVRDRGKGFDQDAVPGDRHGIADSIRGRMERNGGSSTIRTGAGDGTEVRLAMPLSREVSEQKGAAT